MFQKNLENPVDCDAMMHDLKSFFEFLSLIYILFTDAISYRQLLITVRSCLNIDICPGRHLFRVHLYLSIDRFSLSFELVKERERFTSKS